MSSQLQPKFWHDNYSILSTDGRQQHHTIIFIRLQTFSDHIKINK
jgi:hypothetical protein